MAPSLQPPAYDAMQPWKHPLQFLRMYDDIPKSLPPLIGLNKVRRWAGDSDYLNCPQPSQVDNRRKRRLQPWNKPERADPLPKVRLRRMLGRGGFGEAWLADVGGDRESDCVRCVIKLANGFGNFDPRELDINHYLRVGMEPEEAREAVHDAKREYSLLASEFDDIESEKGWHRLFKGSKHMVQEAHTLHSGYLNAPGAMFLEYSAFGSLRDTILRINTKLSEFNEISMNPSPRQHWQVFYCLVKGCIAMACPQTSSEPTDETINTPEENYRGIINIDMDPSNALVGGSNEWVESESHHRVWPIVKPSDYGMMMDGKALSNAHRWYKARGGKYNFTAPERWTMEWLDVELPTENMRNEPWPYKVAGNYGVHTNIFYIGLIMSVFLTQLDAPCPSSMSATVLPQALAPYNPYISLGGYLHSFHTVDMVHTCRGLSDEQRLTPNRLRDIVAQCLAYFPEDRPSLKALLKECEQSSADATNMFNMTDDEYRYAHCMVRWLLGFGTVHFPYLFDPSLPEWDAKHGDADPRHLGIMSRRGKYMAQLRKAYRYKAVENCLRQNKLVPSDVLHDWQANATPMLKNELRTAIENQKQLWDDADKARQQSYLDRTRPSYPNQLQRARARWKGLSEHIRQRIYELDHRQAIAEAEWALVRTHMRRWGLGTGIDCFRNCQLLGQPHAHFRGEDAIKTLQICRKPYCNVDQLHLQVVAQPRIIWGAGLNAQGNRPNSAGRPRVEHCILPNTSTWICPAVQNEAAPPPTAIETWLQGASGESPCTSDCTVSNQLLHSHLVIGDDNQLVLRQCPRLCKLGTGIIHWHLLINGTELTYGPCYPLCPLIEKRIPHNHMFINVADPTACSVFSLPCPPQCPCSLPHVHIWTPVDDVQIQHVHPLGEAGGSNNSSERPSSEPGVAPQQQQHHQQRQKEQQQKPCQQLLRNRHLESWPAEVPPPFGTPSPLLPDTEREQYLPLSSRMTPELVRTLADHHQNPFQAIANAAAGINSSAYFNAGHLGGEIKSGNTAAHANNEGDVSTPGGTTARLLSAPKLQPGHVDVETISPHLVANTITAYNAAQQQQQFHHRTGLRRGAFDASTTAAPLMLGSVRTNIDTHFNFLAPPQQLQHHFPPEQQSHHQFAICRGGSINQQLPPPLPWLPSWFTRHAGNLHSATCGGFSPAAFAAISTFHLPQPTGDTTQPYRINEKLSQLH